MDKSLQLHQSDPVTHQAPGTLQAIWGCRKLPENLLLCPLQCQVLSVQRRTLITSTEQDARGWPPYDARMLGI